MEQSGVRRQDGDQVVLDWTELERMVIAFREQTAFSVFLNGEAEVRPSLSRVGDALLRRRQLSEE